MTWRHLGGVMGILAGVASPAAAQVVGEPVPVETDEIRLPTLAAGVAVGRSMLSELSGSSAGVWTGSIQVGLGRWYVVEGQVSRWSGRDTILTPFGSQIARLVGMPIATIGLHFIGSERRDSTTVMGNFLVRVGSRRVTGLAGAGVGVQHAADRLFGRMEACGSDWCIDFGSDPTVIRHNRLATQIVGGADVALTPRVYGVASVRWQIAPEAGLEMTGGVRVALRSRVSMASRTPKRPAAFGRAGEASSAVGREVRVVDTNGTRQTGTLVGISTSAVMLSRDGSDVVLPLAGVRRVETVPHYARNLGVTAAIGGFFAGWLGSCGSGDENDCWPEIGLMVAWIGAGVGAGIGAMMNSAARRAIYTAPTGTTGLTLAPIITPHRLGAGIAMRW